MSVLATAAVEPEPAEPAEPVQGEQPVSQNRAREQEQESDSELRCTLCGLRACWTK